MVVNLDGVRFLSSAGLRALLEANEFATREDRDLRLVCHSQTANWALETTGLREHFTFTNNRGTTAGGTALSSRCRQSATDSASSPLGHPGPARADD